MINVSDAFKNELNNDNRLYLAYATITLTDGTRLSVTNEHIWANGVKIEESVSDSSSFSIGSAIASKLTLTLNNVYGDFTDYVFDDALVNIQIGLQLPNGTIEKVNRGNYVVTEAVGQNTSLVTLECLDYMYKFNKPYSEVQTIYPSSMGTIVHDICSYCGVTLSTQNFPRHDLVIPNRPEDEALSCLDVISYISQISCCFARINNSNKLVIEWYDTNDITTTEKLITKSAGDYITTKSGDYIVVLTQATDEDFIDGNIVTKIHRIQHTGSHTVQMDDVVITGIRVTNKRDQDTISALAGTEGYVLGVDENPFIQEGYEGTVADLIGERCIGMRFRPMSVTTLNDPTIEAGDRMYFISPIDNAVYKSYITSSTFAIDDWQDLRCDAETPARNSATKYGAATKSFVALRKMVQNETSSREEALRELSIKVDNSSGLYMTAEEQPDGSFIYYQHDKPTIAESSIIWKETAETRTVSTDGGQTWNAGITADGDAIVRLLQAEGINADWINAGTLVIRDNNNNIIFSASKESSTSGGSVFIGAGSVIIGGYNQVQSQSMSDALDSVKTYSDGQLTAYSQQVAQAFDDIQAQLDGQIDSWYYNYNPTLNNAPASDWTTEELRQEHEGDTFTNVDTGDAWRFIKKNNTWIWKVIADTAAAAALVAAQKAQQTADNKIRNFMNVPTPPYEEGDFWIKNDGTILICTNGKESDQAYSANDWEEKVKYTDDTVANQALEEARRAQALNVVLSNEYDSIPTDADGNYTTFPSGIQTTVQTFLGHNDITTQCTYVVNTSSAITGTWNSNTKTYVVTGLSADTGWVDVSATYLNSLTATKRFTVAKVKQGVRGIQGTAGAKGDKGDRGDPGASGRVYILEPSTAVLSRSAMGDVTPGSITWKAYYRDGDEARQPYAGRFKIEELENGEVWTTVYTSSQDETSCKYATGDQLIRKSNGDKLVTKANGDYLLGSHITATNIRCTLYHAGGVITVLDQQSTPVVDDTAGLTVVLSNEAVSVTADSDGMIPDYSECFTYLQVYYGNTHVSDYASYSVPVVSSGLTGTWDTTTKCYRVTNLTPDDGYVDFTVSYKGASVTRRFTISKSKNGVSMTGTTELYALGNSPTTAPADSAFTEGIKTPTSSNKYLWNMERILYSDNSYSTVDKHIVAIYGETGATGVGIQNIENYYAISNSTTAPADSAFDTNVKATTSSNKYLWNYEVTIYSDGSRHKTDKRIIGTYGDKGDKGDKGDSGLPGRVYIVESSANVITKDAKGNTSPDVITFNAYYRDGSSARESYAGRFKIESSTDGTSWTTVYTSSVNESSCRYVLRHQLVTKKDKDKLITKKQGNYIIGPHVDGTMFRCTLYQAGGTTIAQDQQTVPVVTHTTGLTVVLSNETVSVTAETDGTIPDYKECFTDVQAFYGDADVTSLATYSVTKSTGLTGTWDGANHRYTVTNLTPDDGYVDFTVSYKGASVTRRFTISKSKNGVSMTGTTELYALGNSPTTAPADSAFTEGIKTPTSSNKYLWNMERILYSDNSYSTVDKHIVAIYGETGATGVGIQNIENYYAISNSTTAPADSAFDTNVKATTSSNKYLWNYEVTIYSDGSRHKTDKRIIGTYGDKGDKGDKGDSGLPGRVYIVESSANVITKDAKGNTSPDVITFNAYYRDGSSARESYAGRFKIESSTDGTSWTTVYTSSVNESSCRYVLRHQLVTKKDKDKLITKKQGNYIIGPHVDGTMFRCTLYQAGGTTIAQDQQTVPVVTHTTGLTVVLSNETVSVTAETDGTIPDYKECFTDVQAFYGDADVTSLATYSVTKSTGLTGTWDGANHRYTVTNLTPDDGYVDINITYKEVTVTRRFTISKSKDGVWQNNVVELYALNNDANTPPADNAFTEGIKTPSETQRFLWNQERMIYSNGETLTLDKHLIAMYGETGVGISKVEEYYALSPNTTAPADNAFSQTVQIPTSTNKYLWNYELITYTSGETKKTNKHITGTYGDKGDSAIRYYLEFSTKVLKIGKNGAYTPSSVTVSLRQVVGNTGVASAFTGRLKIVEWKNGTQKIRRRETEAGVSVLTLTPSEANIDYIKFEMYNYVNSTYTLLDQESVQCMIDFDALSQEDILDVLTNNGDWEGIYKQGDDYYINFSAAKGGLLILGGKNNENGTLEVRNADKETIVTANKDGININYGSFTIKDINNKVVFGVTNTGVLTSISGSIGGINIADGMIYSGSKKSYNSNTAGFCFESDGDFGVGGQNSYIQWDGSTLAIKGKITATDGEIGGTVISSSSFHTKDKDSYNDSTSGFYVDNSGYFGVGNDENYLTWNGSTLEVSGKIYLGSESSISISDNFTVTSEGYMTAKSGKIGGFTIGEKMFSTTSGLYISTESLHDTIDGVESWNWFIKVSNVFGITGDGFLVSESARIGGMSFAAGYFSAGRKNSYDSSYYGFYYDNEGKFGLGGGNTYIRYGGSGTSVTASFGDVVFTDDVDFTDATVTGLSIEVSDIPESINHGVTFAGSVNCSGIETTGINTKNGYAARFYSTVYFHNLGSEQLTTNYRLLRIDNDNKVRFCNPSSSIRYKEVQRDLTEKDIAKAYNIQPKMAKYKEGVIAKEDQRYNKYFPMFVAENVYDNLPDAVDFNEDGQVETWNQMIMIPLMFQMLKSQKEEIEELKKQINHLN